MAGTNYVVQYSNVTGRVQAMFLKASSDNIATYEADGFLEVDGVKVINGIGPGYGADMRFAVIASPTVVETRIVSNVLEVNDPVLPTDLAYREDEGRNPEFDFPAIAPLDGGLETPPK